MSPGQRPAMVERMRHAELAPTLEEATEAVKVARDVVRRWKLNLGFAAVSLPTGVLGATDGDDPIVMRALGFVLVLTCIGLVVWAFLNRQGALRAIDANRRRWGDL
jgi:protein-S-isoprenylcysteine O-methyltransferase Ste14